MIFFVLLFFLTLTLSAEAQPPVIIHETFDDNRYGWYEGKARGCVVALKNGKYLIDAPDGGWMSSLAPYVEPDRDFSLAWFIMGSRSADCDIVSSEALRHAGRSRLGRNVLRIETR